MGYNKKILSQATAGLNKAKAPAKKTDIIVNQEGQRKYPGQVTKILGDTMATDGYGNIPLMVYPNNGQPPQLVEANTGPRYFPGATEFTEVPVAKKGGEKKYSRSITATNKLFKKNPLVKKKKTKNKKIFDPNAKYYQIGGINSPVQLTPYYSFDQPQSPEAWQADIKNLERQLGNPVQWTMDDHTLMQNKLNDYKAWRETTPEGQAVIDYHNEPNEYVIPIPYHLRNKQKGGNFQDTEYYQEGGFKEETRLKEKMLRRYPGFKKSLGTEGENLHIIADPNFKAGEYGYGNIEVMFPGTDKIAYTPEYTYDSPFPGEYVIPYNPNSDINKGDVFLDMLHLLQNDEEVQPYYNQFKKAALDSRGEDLMWQWEEEKQNPNFVNALESSGTDSFGQYEQNYIDGLLRSELAKKGMGRRTTDKGYKLERSVNSPEMRKAANEIYKYLKRKQTGGDISIPELTEFQNGGEYLELDLTPQQIEEYRKDGYIVEDISVPELTKAQEGLQQPIIDKAQDETETFAFATPAAEKKHKQLMDKTRALMTTVRGREAWYQDVKPKDFTNKELSRFIQGAEDYRKQAEAFERARRKVKEDKISTTDFARMYEERNWSRFDPYVMKEGYKGQYQSAVDEANARKTKNMGVTDAVLEATGAPALKRVVEDPLGTLKAVGQTAADAGVLAAPGIGSIMGAGDPNINPLTGQPYWSGLNKSLDLVSVLPFAGYLGATDDLARASKYLTTQTPLKNAYNINPFAGRLGKYNRVVGQDAVEDIVESGLVRVNENAGVANDLGPFGVVNRTTPYPSFAKAAPQKIYAEQVINQGKTPYIISTNRPMRPSTLGRHGKGKTQFPVDEAGKYMTGFPASEAKVFEFGEPHWLKGYKPVNTPKQLPGSPRTSLNADKVIYSSDDAVNYTVNDILRHNTTMDQLRAERLAALQTPKGKARLEQYIKDNAYLNADRHKMIDQFGLPDFNNADRMHEWHRFFEISPYVPSYDDVLQGIADMKYASSELVDIRKAYQDGVEKLRNGLISDEQFERGVNALKQMEENLGYATDNAYMLSRLLKPKSGSSTINIGADLTPLDARIAGRHELGHYFQAGAKSHLDKELEAITLNLNTQPYNMRDPDAPKGEKSFLGSTWKSNTDYMDKARNYWTSGSRGAEKVPFMEEVRAVMLEDGTIKNLYDEITPEMIQAHRKKYLEGSTEYPIRIYDIVDDTNPENFKIMSSVLNRMPAVVPTVGAAGAATYLANPWNTEENLKFEDGGIVVDLNDESQIQNYIDQGYIVEFDEGGFVPSVSPKFVTNTPKELPKKQQPAKPVFTGDFTNKDIKFTSSAQNKGITPYAENLLRSREEVPIEELQKRYSKSLPVKSSEEEFAFPGMKNLQKYANAPRVGSNAPIQPIQGGMGSLISNTGKAGVVDQKKLTNTEKEIAKLDKKTEKLKEVIQPSFLEKVNRSQAQAFQGPDVYKAKEDLDNLLQQGQNYLTRRNLKNSATKEPTVKPLIENKEITEAPSIITGDPIYLNKRRYYTQEVVDLNSVKLGYRNRNEYRDIDTEAGNVTAFNPFLPKSKMNLSKIKNSETFIGIDKNGKFKTGTIDKFNSDDLISKTFSNVIVDFVYNPDGTVKLEKRNKDNPNNPVPVVKVIENGKEKLGSLNFLTKSGVANPYEQFGEIQGGRVILKSGNKTILVSGSVNDVVTQFKKLKEETKQPIELITLDNGSYNLGIRTKDKKITAQDLKEYDNLNNSGGNFLYLLTSSAPVKSNEGFKPKSISDASKVKVQKDIPDFSNLIDSPTARYFKNEVIDKKYTYGMSTDPLLKAKKSSGKGLPGEKEIDCSGAICKVLTKKGINIGDPTVENSAQHFHDRSKPVKWANIKDGDLITMKTSGGKVDHIGFIVIDKKTGKKFIAESSRSFNEGRIVPFKQRIDFLKELYPDFIYSIRRL